MLDRAVAAMSGVDEPWKSVAREPQVQGCYCKGKIILKVVDMLTYPRPVRKFEVSGGARRGAPPPVRVP